MKDFIFNGKGHGTIASKLLANGMDIGMLRPYIGTNGQVFVTINGAAQPIDINATLRKDEWKQYDEAVLRAKQDRLVGVGDLNSRGLTYNIPNGLGKMVLEYEDESDITDAQMSMDAVTDKSDDRVEYELKSLPLPIIHKGFNVSIRNLLASRTTGQPIDTTMAELSTRKVTDKVETMLFNGTSSFGYGGGTIYGYTDYPNRNTATITDWLATATTPAMIIADVLAIKQALLDDGFFGPFMLYVPANYETLLDEDYNETNGKTIRERIKAISNIIDIKVIDKLAASNVLMVQMSSDVVRMVNGMAVSTVEWEEKGGLIVHYKVMTIQVPQIRARQDNTCGICHATTS